MGKFLPADLTRPELVDQQGTSLRFFPAIEAVQLSGHLIQLFISVVELGQELRVGPLQTDKKRHNKVILNAVTAIYDRSTDVTHTDPHTHTQHYKLTSLRDMQPILDRWNLILFLSSFSAKAET